VPNRGNQPRTAQSVPIIDQAADSVALTSALRESVAAKAGETLAQRKASTQNAQNRVTALRPGIVIGFFTRKSLQLGLGAAEEEGGRTGLFSS
jgi:hypothetical protein